MNMLEAVQIVERVKAAVWWLGCAIAVVGAIAAWGWAVGTFCLGVSIAAYVAMNR